MPGLVPGIHVFPGRGISKTWVAGTSSAKTRFALLPGHDGLLSSKIDQTDPVGHQSGLVLAFDLDADAGARLQFRRLAQLGFRQRKAAADARARAYRRNEAQLVEAV